MKILTTIKEMTAESSAAHAAGKTVALVPTMGALHAGHLSLIDLAKQHADIVVVSVFVNPTQFGPQEDFNKYPRPFEADCALAMKQGCDIVFAPSKQEMYPREYFTYVTVDTLSDRLCGAFRPGHFKGVSTVVLKFFNIVAPDYAVFGLKDIMQCIVIKRMADDLNLPVELVFAPTIRESDGLAMSSRNVYLTIPERTAAPGIRKALQKAAALFEEGEKRVSVLTKSITDAFEKEPLFAMEYVEIVDTLQAKGLEIIESKAIVAIAVRTKESKTRLIDNIVLGGSL